MLDFGGGTLPPLAELPHVAGVAHRAEPDVVRRIVAEVRGIVDAREALLPRARHRLDRDLPARAGRRGPGRRRLRRRLPGRRRLAHAARRVRRARAADPASSPRRGLTFGVHVVVTATRWMDFRDRDPRPVRHPPRAAARRPDRLRDRPQGRRQRAHGPPRPRPQRRASCTSSPPCRASTTAGTVDDLGDGVEDLVARVTAAWPGPPGPKLRLLPGAGHPRAGARARRAPTTAALLLGIDETRPRAGRARPRRVDRTSRLRRRRQRQVGLPARLRARGDAAARARGGQLFVVDYRRALLGELPESHLGEYLTTADQATAGRRGHHRVPAHAACPGPTSPPSSCGTARGGRAPRSTCSSTTTTWSRPGRQPAAPARAAAGPGPRRRAAPGPDPRAAAVPPGRCTSRCSRPCATSGSPGLLLSGNPDEGALIGRTKPTPQPPGRGRIVSRELGEQVLQLAWQPPRLG